MATEDEHTEFIFLGFYTVSRCRSRGESEVHPSEKARKRPTLALKPRADITRSPKQGYQWPHKKDLCPQKFFEKNVSWFPCPLPKFLAPLLT